MTRDNDDIVPAGRQAAFDRELAHIGLGLIPGMSSRDLPGVGTFDTFTDPPGFRINIDVRVIDTTFAAGDLSSREIRRRRLGECADRVFAAIRDLPEEARGYTNWGISGYSEDPREIWEIRGLPAFLQIVLFGPIHEKDIDPKRAAIVLRNLHDDTEDLCAGKFHRPGSLALIAAAFTGMPQGGYTRLPDGRWVFLLNEAAALRERLYNLAKASP